MGLDGVETADASSPAGSDTVGKGEVFDLLSNHRRRYTIHYCKREENPVELSDLAEGVAAWELDKPVDELTSSERKRVYTALQQTHLPTLERAGMIEFDDRTVELTNKADDLEVYLDIVPGNSIPWGLYYLGLSLLSVVGSLVFWADLVPIDLITPLVWGTGMGVLFLVSALVHVTSSRRLRLGSMEDPP